MLFVVIFVATSYFRISWTSHHGPTNPKPSNSVIYYEPNLNFLNSYFLLPTEGVLFAEELSETRIPAKFVQRFQTRSGIFG